MKQYANNFLYTDVRPYEVIRVVSEKTLVVRGMTVEPDPTWTRTYIPGGFCSYTLNNYEQRWIITSDPDGVTLRIRLRKNGEWYGGAGRFILSDRPIYFYDYNF